jgi:uncharacterized protein
MRAMDLFVNVTMGSAEKPEYLLRVAEDYFKRSDEMFRDFTIDEMLEIMDRCGVEKSVLSLRAETPSEPILDFARKRPDRFVYAAYVDPRNGMKAVRALEKAARENPVVLCRMVPFMINTPPDDKVYYPIYSKCIELGLPVSVNTGIPGPPAPGKCQDPMHLDEVCLFFPELKLIMTHGADPWWQVAIRLMIKYKNLYLMTSAFAPKYFPQELIHYMNTRGQDKIMFASDHPVLSMERCIKEAHELDLREGVLEKFLYKNAERVLFPSKA